MKRSEYVGGGLDARQQKGIRVRVQMVGIHQSFTAKVFLSFWLSLRVKI